MVVETFPFGVLRENSRFFIVFHVAGLDDPTAIGAGLVLSYPGYLAEKLSLFVGQRNFGKIENND